MKILLINSDLAKNRGDRAIAEGAVALLRQHFPDAQITGISECAERDRQWFGIDFLPMDTQSLSLFKFLQLRRAAKQSDLIFWGGGEILKDYTNKGALWYWVLKIFLLSRANPNIYGFYQGIGPTKSKTSRRLIAFIVRHCRKFIVRDDESRQKLVAWGAPSDKIISSSDPAVVPKPHAPSNETEQTLFQDFGIGDDFLENFICIGPRDWFHYKPGGILPFKYKKKLHKLLGKNLSTETPKSREYRAQLVRLVDMLTTTHQTNILLSPMHMAESDGELCQYIKDNAAHGDMIRVLGKDTLSPSQTRSVISRAKAMVGFRLHSNIVGVSAGVPSINIYYVDKGRVFFDQIGQSHFALPIEKTLESGFLDEFSQLFEELLTNRDRITTQINTKTDELRQLVSSALDEAMHEK